jgi:DNA-binding IscR family transcriptional regulator
MLRVSKLTDYATVLMAALADGPDELASASDLAERARFELPTVSKLLKQLAGAGLIESRRGVGGYRLARPARHFGTRHRHRHRRPDRHDRMQRARRRLPP